MMGRKTQGTATGGQATAARKQTRVDTHPPREYVVIDSGGKVLYTASTIGDAWAFREGYGHERASVARIVMAVGED